MLIKPQTYQAIRRLVKAGMNPKQAAELVCIFMEMRQVMNAATSKRILEGEPKLKARS